MDDGLMFYDQSSCSLYGQVSYHDFEGLAQEKDEAPRIIADLGDNFAMIMRNHGLLTVGRTIGEAFAYMRRLIGACEVQSRLLVSGTKLRKLPQDVLEFTKSQMDARHTGKPYGELDWKMYRRLADKLDPDFAN
jgi:ribulose-5-phosphate 4-epimerase/fuculose-1-phosphate aldolase